MGKKSFDIPQEEIDLGNKNDAYDGEKELEYPVKTEKENEAVSVEKSVGLFGAISLIVGTMIGSGIFASATTVSINAGSVGMALLAWLGSGILATLGALCYIELGLMIQESGGEYVYLKRAFGELPAFLFLYTANLLLKPAGIAGVALTTGSYIVEPFYVCNPQDKMLIAKLIGAMCLGIILFVNCASVKWATSMQMIFTVAKLGAIALIIITGIVRASQGYTENFASPFEGTSKSLGKIGLAFYGGLWAYDGWNNLNYCIEELKNPVKDLPKAIMIGIPLVTVLYALINAAYLTVLTPMEINTTGAVAVTIAERLYGVMAWIVPVLVACSTFGAANGVIFGAGRIVSVSARQGNMPRLLGMVHSKRYTPIPGLFFTAVVGWLMLIPESSNFSAIITYFNFAAWIFYGSTFLSVIVLRFKHPEWERPYKVFIGVPIVLVACSLYLVGAPFSENPLESFYCLLFILSGIPFYLCFVKYQILPKSVLQAIDKATFKLQTVIDLTMVQRTNS